MERIISSSVKGEEYIAKVEIRVYAPASENGSGLSEIVSEMLTGLKKADTNKIIVESGATSIEFDSNMNAIYRVISFEISFCLCEEG
jgi:putative NADH-flavin reductase